MDNQPPADNQPVQPPQDQAVNPQQTQVQPQVQSFQPAPAAQQWQASPQPASQQGTNPGKTMGIVALVLSVIGFYLFGFIFGLIAMSKSKKAGFGMNVMGLIAVIWSALGTMMLIPLTFIVLANFSAVQDTADDTVTITRINSLHAKLEEYYNSNNGYPLTLESAVFSGIDPGIQEDIDSGLYGGSISSSQNVSGAEIYPDPTLDEPYQYIPYDCDQEACNGYILRAYIQRPTTTVPNPYTKYGLQNP